jgi:hypothetical protein
MRTFSLIWSGIGCFATVAITVLGGVILAGGNNARAAGSMGLFLLIWDNEINSSLWGTEGASFEGLDLNPEGSLPGQFKSFYYFDNVSIGYQIVIEGADFSARNYLDHWGNCSIAFSNDNTRATVTITGKSNVTRNTISGSYGYPTVTHPDGIICFHLGVKGGLIKVTARISMDE